MANLTVFTGSMFSGKSTRLQAEGARLRKNNKKILFVTPAIDDRYGESVVTTHDGAREPALSISKITEDELDKMREYEAVLFDEIQFFEDDIVLAINRLVRSEVDVLVAGLNMDRFANPFQTTIKLMATADKIEVLKASCSICGEDGWGSYSPMDSKEQIIIGTEQYIPLCRNCYFKKSGGYME